MNFLAQLQLTFREENLSRRENFDYQNAMNKFEYISLYTVHCTVSGYK